MPKDTFWFLGELSHSYYNQHKKLIQWCDKFDHNNKNKQVIIILFDVIVELLKKYMWHIIFANLWNNIANH